jgi:hypothetical protein
MRLSRLFFLLFRYLILAVAGVAIASLWKICRLEDYEFWGRFYALWIPLLYGLFSTAYQIAAASFTRGMHGTGTELSGISERFQRYDEYTYLLILWIFVLEIAGTSLENVRLWLSISYLTLIVLKSGIFLMGLYKQIDDTQMDAASKVASIFRRIQYLLVLSSLIVYSLISAYHIHRTSTTGDEPHYLLITHSLWYDHDTNLDNNYQNQDYKSFFWYDLQPAELDRVNATTVYSYRHKGGFPLMLIPGYVFGRQFGAVLEMNLITALLMLQVFLLSYELFQSLTASFLTWICLSFTIPMIIYMGQIYPDTLAALLVLWGVRHIYQLHPGDSWRNPRFWLNCLLIGGTLILLVFLKARYLPLSATLGFFLIVRLFQGSIAIKHKLRMAVGIGLTLVVVVVAVWLVDTFFLKHLLWERIGDKKYMEWMLSGYNPLFGFLGLLFDQEYGVLPYTPFYLLALVGIGILTRQEFKVAWPIMGIFSFNYLAICFWPLWHAAPTPPPRYILPVLPLLGVFLTRFFIQKNGSVKAITLGTSMLWSSLTAWIVTLTPKWRYNWADGTNNLLEAISFRLAVDLTKLFPSWIRPSLLTSYLTIMGILGIGGLIYYCRIHAKRARVPSQSWSLEPAVMLIVIICIMLALTGLIIGKKMPIFVLEAEDALDMRASGGERVPSNLDPWENQIYLKSLQYYGWKLFPGNSLKARPKLLIGKVNLEIYARAEPDKRHPTDMPVMIVFVNEKEVGRTIVSLPGWIVYKFSFLVDERRPWIEIKHEDLPNSERALMIDKVRFK